MTGDTARATPDFRAWLILALLMLLTAAVYLPSLRGGFVFDDGYYFLDNQDVHVDSLDVGAWARAALSQAGMNQFRALGMLSFAANYYFTGLDPFWLKATNLGIHLGNGLLLSKHTRLLTGLPGRPKTRARLPVGLIFRLKRSGLPGFRFTL